MPILILTFPVDAPAAQDRISIAAVGDVMMGTAHLLPKDGGKSLFNASAKFIKGNDIAFFNYEGTLTETGKGIKDTSTGRSYAFKTPPGYGRWLARAGFNLASIANNHLHDFGLVGKSMTMAVLSSHGIAYSGPPGVVARLIVRGRRVAMIAFAPYVHSNYLLDIPAAKRMVGNLSRKNDIVIVSMHAGMEGEEASRTPREMEFHHGEERGEVVKFSRAMVDAGADLVLGHGPHVPRAMEFYKKRLIAYSLGNFCTMLGIRVTHKAGLAPLLLAKLDGTGKVIEGRIVSFQQRPGLPPVLDRNKKAARLIHSLGLKDFPDSNAVNADGSLRPPK